MLLGPYSNEQIEQWAKAGWDTYHADGPVWDSLTEPAKHRQISIARDMAIYGGASTPLETAYRDAFLAWQQGEPVPEAPPLAEVIEKPKKKRS